MASTTTAGKTALLGIGLKGQMEVSGVNPSAVFVYLAGGTTIATVNATAAAPSAGAMTIAGNSGVGVATGTLTAVELRDRSGQALRTYTIGAAASGRDILVTPSGSGIAASGNDIVISSIGITIGALTLTETPAT
jgi:hypothetical protein